MAPQHGLASHRRPVSGRTMASSSSVQDVRWRKPVAHMPCLNRRRAYGIPARREPRPPSLGFVHFRVAAMRHRGVRVSQSRDDLESAST